MENKPKAFSLLTHIANTARRKSGHPDGLLVGQCHLQSWAFYKFTEREYRTAKEILVKRKHIKIIETNRTRQKSTTGTTTKSTLVELCSTTIYDINIETNDDRNDDRATTDRRLTDDKSRRNKKDQEEKDHHPQTPSGASDLLSDDSSKSEIEICPGVFLSEGDLEKCIQKKGSFEAAKYAIEQIQNSPKRTAKIKNWPKAVENWNVGEDPKVLVEKNTAYAERICWKFREFSGYPGWRCSMYRDNDEQGVLFEHPSVYIQSVFVPLADGDFEQKCKKIVGE